LSILDGKTLTCASKLALTGRREPGQASGNAEGSGQSFPFLRSGHYRPAQKRNGIMANNPVIDYCSAVRELVDTEKQNLEAGTHRPGRGPKDECIERRANRLRQREQTILNLRRLAALVQPAARDAGFSAETVERRLDASLKAAEALTHWENGLRPLAEDSNDRAEAKFVELVERVWAALEPVENMVGATAGVTFDSDILGLILDAAKELRTCITLAKGTVGFTGSITSPSTRSWDRLKQGLAKCGFRDHPPQTLPTVTDPPTEAVAWEALFKLWRLCYVDREVLDAPAELDWAIQAIELHLSVDAEKTQLDPSLNPSSEAPRHWYNSDPDIRTYTELVICISACKEMWVFARGLVRWLAELESPKAKESYRRLLAALDKVKNARRGSEWSNLCAWQFLVDVQMRLIRPNVHPNAPWETSWAKMRQTIREWTPEPTFAEFLAELKANLDRLQGEMEPVPGLETALMEEGQRAEDMPKKRSEVPPVIGTTPKKESKDDPELTACHGLDYRSVNWFGADHPFTANQAACVKVLWEAWEKNLPDVGDKTVLEIASVFSERLDSVFRDHPAWGTMIQQGRTKGTHRLVEPNG
jgi:hypothetical protein